MAVEDTGVGMSAETLSLLFQRFQQAERSQGGSGLGLFITKRIVDAMSGQITYHSAPGRGTTAHVRVPVEALPFACPLVEARTDGLSRQRRLARPLHVLIAEDNDVNRRASSRTSAAPTTRRRTERRRWRSSRRSRGPLTRAS